MNKHVIHLHPDNCFQLLFTHLTAYNEGSAILHEEEISAVKHML